MAETQEPFCPLYQEAIEAAPWNKDCKDANVGLLFDKFACAWRSDAKTTFAFDKGTDRQKEGAGNWLRNISLKKTGAAAQLAEACTRQRQLAQAIGGKTLLLKNSSRFITGMGREHPLENGFAWHHTLGVPYLPGSSLKGMLRAWYRESNGEFNDRWREDRQTKALFGSQENGIGQFMLLDLLPTAPPQLVVDIMTPHYGPYYQDKDGKTIPGDWHSPVPISFLAVEAGQTWQLAILPGPSHRTIRDTDFDELQAELLESLDWLGAGAKTAVGYGRFERDVKTEEEIKLAREKERQSQEEKKRQAAEQAKFEASLVNDSAALQKLKILQREKEWKLEAGDASLKNSLINFAENNPTLPQDCLDFIREQLESIPKYKGVWDNPDAIQGKAKNPKYKSTWIRELVKRLNSNSK